MICCQCGKKLDADEVGLTRKLVNRGATEFFCFDCLGKRFHATREQLLDMVEAFRQAGCTLFL